jgi:hypothetical protein
LDDAPSVGIAKLIPLDSFRNIMPPRWGVGRFTVSVPEGLGLTVVPLPDPEWREYANAHAVITGYQSLSNKQRTDIERRLRDVVRTSVIVVPIVDPNPRP